MWSAKCYLDKVAVDPQEYKVVRVFKTESTACENEQMHLKAGLIVRTYSSELLSKKFKDSEERGKECLATERSYDQLKTSCATLNVLDFVL